MARKVKALPAPKDLAAEALALYVAEAKATKARVLSPVAATRVLAEKYGGGTSRVASPVARVYYAENGRRNPLDGIGPDSKPGAIRRAVVSRRDYPLLADGSGESADGNATLGRWETVAASASASLGRRVSVAEAKRLYGDVESYVGRGTKAAAPSLR
jgi:hypothetical protein